MANDDKNSKADNAALQKDAKAAKEKIDSEKEHLRKAAEDYKNSLQRLQAEFENYRKRIDKENAALALRARAETVRALLPVLDSFELALKSTEDHEKFAKGVEMIFAQFHSTLEDMGLRQISAAGQPFDPYRHEVLLQEESEKEGLVIEELQRGYMLGDMVLRHTKVKVGVKKSGNVKQ